MNIDPGNLSAELRTGPAVTTLYGILDAQRQRDPETTALIGLGREPLSYGRLLTQVESVAGALNGLGIGCNDRVAIVLPNGPEMAVAFLSVAACATSAPLNPGYRAKEYDFYLSDLDAKALIVSADSPSDVTEVAQRLGIPVVSLAPLVDEPAGLFELADGESRSTEDPVFAGPDDIALVLHTSGTTSRPKIVPLTQRNLCSSAANIRATLALTPADRCLNVMPLFHIHGLMGATLSSLSAGASVVCTPGFDKARFFSWLADLQPTWYSAVPTMHQAVVTEASSHGSVVSEARLRLVRSSSSSLPPRVMSDLEDLFGCPVIESYGMTEAAHQMTSNPLPPGQRKPGSVGIAAGPQVAIMGEGETLLRAPAVGEIVIQGVNVTLGYENNEEANAAGFTGGWFRTGDQGYFDEDGYLFITGRLKEIINRGGEKVAPREVDEALLEHPAVVQATAFAVAHPTLGEDVAAAVILDPAAPEVSERDLRDFAFVRLADFKVPSQIVIVEAIPKGATGKLQRIGLADKLKSEMRAEFVEPRTDLERDLAALWCSALGVEKIGVLDNFFAQGGDSITAAELFVNIEDRLKKRMPLAILFQAPTIEQLAKAIEDDAWSSQWSSLVAIQPQGTRPPFFFVHAHGGNVVGFRDLAERLGSDQPFYGLQARGLEGMATESRDFEQMAAAYIEEIRAVQSIGPYYLGGWCMGGTIAYEMAHQLSEQGDEVELLVMVQATHGEYPRPRAGLAWARPVLRVVERFELELGLLEQAGSGHRMRHVRVRARELSDLVTPFGNTPQRLKRQALEEAHHRAAARYRPPTYGGRVLLVRAGRQPRGIVADGTLGFGELLKGEVTLSEVPGFRLGLLSEPRVQGLAQLLADHLASD